MCGCGYTSDEAHDEVEDDAGSWSHRYWRNPNELDFSAQGCLTSYAKRKLPMTYYTVRSPEPDISPKSTSQSDAHAEIHEEQPYATCEVLWSESGLWKEEPAHFMFVKIQHIGSASRPIDRVYLTVNLAGVVKGPFGTPNDRATRIGLFGPVEVRGLPKTESMGSSDEIKGREHFKDGANSGERFIYTTGVYQGEILDGPRLETPPTVFPANGLDNWCYHLVDATVMIQVYGNPAHGEDAPDVTIGMVVLTKGKAVTLCAHSTSAGTEGQPYYILRCTNPVKFSSTTPALIPEGHLALGPVFNPESVKAKIRELCSWTDPYQAILFAFDDGHLEP